MKQGQSIRAYKQFVLIFCCMLSLFVSSVSACACSHHQEKPKTEVTSCHGHTEEANAESSRDNNSSETIQTIISEGKCFCIQSSPKVIAKSEKVKIEKQQIAVLPYLQGRTAFVFQTISVKSAFITPFYLTDSFYNLTPGRAPPGL